MPIHNQAASTLDAVMRKTEGLLAGTTADLLDRPTPCSDWDVAQLENHLVGWARHFAARESGRADDEDPSTYRVKSTAAAEFGATIDPLVDALDKKLSAPPENLPEGAFPTSATTTMLIGEYVIHGWDLATATGQDIPFTEREATAALGLRDLLTPEFRGQMFGPEVAAPADATPLVQLIAFAGRRPR